MARRLFRGPFPVRALAWASLAANSLLPGQANALPRTWIGGNVDWVDGGAATNWNPNDEPDSDDEAIFNTANSVSLGSNNAVNGLTLSGGIDLFANDFDLIVDGLVQLTGASTNLNVGGAAGSIDADNVTINGGVLELAGGGLVLNEEVGASLLDLNAGGTLQGNGVITFSDAPLAFTTVFSNDGTLTALSRPAIIFGMPPVGTLQINTGNAFSLIDLDGSGNLGVVNVNRNQTLDVNGALADAFGGTMNLFHESTLDMSNSWALNAGTLTANNGFVAGGIGVSDTPAGTSFIKGGTLTQTGGVINVPDTDGTLQFDANFTMSGGSLTNFGTVIFNGVTNITTSAGYAPSAFNSQTIVNNSVTINDGASDFNWDGTGDADTTVNAAGSLSITAAHVDTGDDNFGGTINLVGGGDLTVNVAATSWTLVGTLAKTGAATSAVTGDRIVVTGSITNNDGGTLDLPPISTTATTSLITNSTTTLGGGTEFNGASAIGGFGLLRLEGISTVLASTTINTATFDWDGLGSGTTHTINPAATFTINAAVLDSDGDMDDPLVLMGSGSQLTVNSISGLTEWTMNGVVTGNASTIGTSLISGTSRMIVANVINVKGNTTINAPVTFNRNGFVADIDAGMTLDVTSSATTYADGTIDGAGAYDPGTTNLVTGDFAINPDNFDFDGGSWTIESGAELTFNVTDYEPDSLSNSFENTLTLNNGAIFANSADPAIVMNGTMNMNASGGFSAAEWNGDAVNIGNDAAILDANLNVTGDGNPNSQARFFAPVTFLSDADVDVPAGATLVLNRTVNFDTVNAANNAEFTGAGTIILSDVVNVNEAVTLNMVGGTVDLDGNDAVGDFVNVDAPITINAATLTNFGRVNGGGGTNTLDVNNSVGTGVLTVNLDDPNGEWTLNGPGVMNLVNDNVEATLLAGSDVNVNGTVNVVGDVRTTARLDIAGTVNVNTAAQPFRLAGGNGTNDMNTLAGGTISGAGILGADTGKGLTGHGTINTAVDFDGTADLVASGGTLTFTNFITDVNTIRTSGDSAIFNFTQPVTTNVTDDGILMEGGKLQGAQLTVAANIKPLRGTGLVNNQVVNNGLVQAAGGDLILQTAANDNDWDGVGNAGSLSAINDVTLELRDNLTFGFTGNVTATSGGRVFSNGFALDFNPGSSINLTEATYQSTASTGIGGTVTINAGQESTIQVQNNTFLTFETGSATTLNGNLRAVNNNISIEAGATFAGTGALVFPDGSHFILDNGANVNVLVANDGTFRPSGFNTVGAVTVKDYQQGNTGELLVELAGTLLNQYDRVLVGGNAILDGYLNIEIDGGFVPALGNTFDILSATFGRSGTFDTVDVSGMPAGLAFHLDYLPNTVRLTVVNKPIYTADFDEDGDVDGTDLTFWKNAYNLNQLGDADGDNDSDGADFLLWQQQFGSAPAVAIAQPAAAAVPEPSAAALLLVAMAGAGWRRSRDRLRA
ncbi:beta strand repeat-containing protein [Lacipirellula limnantheis]|uniref:Autotransporter-associated beta strand repeat protein n=1 Tax=Lacipirellula limnantheis TaxID=2528024 RepID=A0A517TSC0_9BACT|nr:PEP-CTERM sorting domain-containing protein [Lacipirellula limnantheis]QDT71270.1 hypothetical protein I41_04260 [Lacipirellula limnantheis]